MRAMRQRRASGTFFDRTGLKRPVELAQRLLAFNRDVIRDEAELTARSLLRDGLPGGIQLRRFAGTRAHADALERDARRLLLVDGFES